MTGKSRRVEAVFFDLDDTLLDHQGASDAAIVQLLRRFGYGDVQQGTVVRLWRRLEDEYMWRYLKGEMSFADQRRARIRRLFEALGRGLSFGQADEAFVVYLEFYESNWRLFPDVLPALKDLEGFGTGILTNGDPDQQRAKLEALDVASRFDPVVTWGEVGASKPSPAIFREACARVSLKPISCAYVGDRINSDALAAKKIGMLGVWLNRNVSDDDPSQGLTDNVPTIRASTELVDHLY